MSIADYLEVDSKLFQDTSSTKDKENNMGKWNKWYRNISKDKVPNTYGDDTTYRMAAEFLKDVDTVEDWGCGGGGFTNFRKTGYVGVDGSKTPFADKIVDLSNYTSNVQGIHLRHILEHNYKWEDILRNALISFTHKLCLTLFTPFTEVTKRIAHNKINVPDISFRKEDITDILNAYDVKFTLIDNIKTTSQYDVEHVFFIEK